MYSLIHPRTHSLIYSLTPLDVARISYSDVIQFLDEENEKILVEHALMEHDRTSDDDVKGGGVEGVDEEEMEGVQGIGNDRKNTDHYDAVKKSNNHDSHQLNNNSKISSLSSFKMAQIQAQIKTKLKDSTRYVFFCCYFVMIYPRYVSYNVPS